MSLKKHNVLAREELEASENTYSIELKYLRTQRAQVHALLAISETLDYHLSNITGTLKGEK